jgi:penicillin-binding protein 1C
MKRIPASHDRQIANERKTAPNKRGANLSRSRRFVRRVGWCVVGTGGVFGLVLAIAFIIVWRQSAVDLTTIKKWPSSPRVLDRDDNVLFQTVGRDEHWRIPVDLDDISHWLIDATVAAEDQRFLEHQGVDANAVLRAAYQNITSAEVISGASTISMQLCRMMQRRPRSLKAKFIEAVQALQIERQLSKRQILNHYLNVAPYGGNLLGVEAAAQRYFRKSAAELSLGEATLLAGLPQSPSRFRPDRFPDRARKRQAYVLERMQSLGLIDDKQRRNAIAEPISIRKPQPTTGSHIASLAIARRRQGGRTTIDSELQREVHQAVMQHSRSLPAGSDVAVVVIDIETSEIRSLVGSSDFRDPTDGQVNGALAKRSPGSALKPFIYAAAFEAQRLAPDTLVIDQPIERAGWTPDNFDRSFQGEMTIAQALQASRNVPAILVMEGMGVSRCVGVLESVGIKLAASAATRGGLSVCVGTAETSLLQLTNGYATLGRAGVHCPPRFFRDEPIQSNPAISARTASAINQVLSTQQRSPNASDINGAAQFMWKTGTSSGRRDAWAVGHNGRFAIGVWVGRFSGAGHSLFVGRTTAEPLLAQLFSHVGINNADDSWLKFSNPIVVTRPLKFENRPNDPRIQSPARNATYIATDSVTNIPVVALNAPQPRWFLNGRLMDASQLRRLSLKTGSYQLRCLSNGKTDSVSFRVEQAIR